MALARFRMITRGVHITVSVTSMVLIQMKYGCMENGFIQQIMVFLVMEATERSPPDNLMRWIITQSKGFTRKGIDKISRSVVAFVYLVLSSQVQARSTIVGNSAPAVDAQQLFKDTFKPLINKDLSIDIEKYQRVLEHALSKVDFSVGIGIYMLPSNLN